MFLESFPMGHHEDNDIDDKNEDRDVDDDDVETCNALDEVIS
jgi:hypothetical protein